MVTWHGDPYKAGGLGGRTAKVSLWVREGSNAKDDDRLIIFLQNLFMFERLRLTLVVVK